MALLFHFFGLGKPVGRTDDANGKKARAMVLAAGLDLA